MSVSTSGAPRTGAVPVVVEPFDPARRKDVLLRVRREPGSEASAWWGIGAFLVWTAIVIGLLGYIPSGN